LARIISIDYGKKRVGIAVTDNLQIIASGLTTVASNEIIKFLKDYFLKEQVERIIVGYPKQMDNTESDSMKYITPFVNSLKNNFKIPIEMYDERFTSKIAFQTMIDAGLKKKARQNKALVDEISAVIILQSYLESKSL